MAPESISQQPGITTVTWLWANFHQVRMLRVVRLEFRSREPCTQLDHLVGVQPKFLAGWRALSEPLSAIHCRAQYSELGCGMRSQFVRPCPKALNQA